MSKILIQLTMDDLILEFESAKRCGTKFFAILVRMDGFPKDEIIINESDNFDSKLEYYKKTYDGNLQHKYSQGISIVGFTYANCLDTIQADLID